MRPTREETLMKTAFLWSERSTCSRLSVGAVFSRDGRILTQGYNGAPAGLGHCNHECDCDQWGWVHPDNHHHKLCAEIQPCTRAVHAEQNGISFAARWGVGLEGSHLSVTHQPCISCAQSTINAGIVSVDYVHPYRLEAGLLLLGEAGIGVRQVIDFSSDGMVE